jgi:hypothetical protein
VTVLAHVVTYSYSVQRSLNSNVRLRKCNQIQMSPTAYSRFFEFGTSCHYAPQFLISCETMIKPQKEILSRQMAFKMQCGCCRMPD